MNPPLIVGFTLEAKLVSSKHLIQVNLEILSRSVENMASHMLTILGPLPVHIVHVVSISYWSSVDHTLGRTSASSNYERFHGHQVNLK